MYICIAFFSFSLYRSIFDFVMHNHSRLFCATWLAAWGYIRLDLGGLSRSATAKSREGFVVKSDTDTSRERR